MIGNERTTDSGNVWRTIRSANAHHVIIELLQGLFSVEFMCPSQDVWLLSPWISDIPVLDNAGGRFQSVEPDWPRSEIRLTSVLRKMARSGSQIHVATRPVEHNDEIRRFLGEMRARDGLPVTIYLSEVLHEKGLLTDHLYLSGSMNFTRNGIAVNEEAVHCTSDKSEIARHKLAFSDYWRGLSI